MNAVTREIKLDLAQPGGGLDFLSTVYAVQGDSYSRFVAFVLYSNGEEYTPPVGTSCIISGICPDGSTVSPYSTITQNNTVRSAYTIEDNILTVELSPSVCSRSGPITLTCQLIGSEGETLSTWPIACRIESSAVEAASGPELPSESASAAAARAEAAATRAQDAADRAEMTVNELLLLAHPVGSFYWSSDSTSPAQLFGGDWEQIKDRFLLAAGDTYTAGETGGEAEHTLTIGEIASHIHDWKGHVVPTAPGGSSSATSTYAIFGNDSAAEAGFIANGQGPQAAGGGEPHNNMPPYIVVYCWRRIA